MVANIYKKIEVIVEALLQEHYTKTFIKQNGREPIIHGLMIGGTISLGVYSARNGSKYDKIIPFKKSKQILRQ